MFPPAVKPMSKAVYSKAGAVAYVATPKISQTWAAPTSKPMPMGKQQPPTALLSEHCKSPPPVHEDAGLVPSDAVQSRDLFKSPMPPPRSSAQPHYGQQQWEQQQWHRPQWDDQKNTNNHSESNTLQQPWQQHQNQHQRQWQQQTWPEQGHQQQEQQEQHQEQEQQQQRQQQQHQPEQQYQQHQHEWQQQALQQQPKVPQQQQEQQQQEYRQQHQHQWQQQRQQLQEEVPRQEEQQQEHRLPHQHQWQQQTHQQQPEMPQQQQEQHQEHRQQHQHDWQHQRHQLQEKVPPQREETENSPEGVMKVDVQSVNQWQQQRHHVQQEVPQQQEKTENSPEATLKVGMKVDAQCVGWGPEWYPGTIRELAADGEIQILWDGDEPSVSNVPPQNVRPAQRDTKSNIDEAKPIDVPSTANVKVSENMIIETTVVDASTNGTASEQVHNSTPVSPHQLQSTPAPAPTAAMDVAKESHGQKHAREEATAPSGTGTAPVVVASSVLNSVRSYRYDLVPGDDIVAPMSNVRRRVEAEIGDGLVVTLTLHIVRDPEASIRPAVPSTLAAPLEELGTTMVAPSKPPVAPIGSTTPSSDVAQTPGNELPRMPPIVASTPPLLKTELQDGADTQESEKNPVTSLHTTSHPAAPSQTTTVQATEPIGNTGVMINGASNASMPSPPSTPSMPNIPPMPQIPSVLGVSFAAKSAGPFVAPPGMSQLHVPSIPQSGTAITPQPGQVVDSVDIKALARAVLKCQNSDAALRTPAEQIVVSGNDRGTNAKQVSAKAPPVAAPPVASQVVTTVIDDDEDDDDPFAAVVQTHMARKAAEAAAKALAPAKARPVVAQVSMSKAKSLSMSPSLIAQGQ